MGNENHLDRHPAIDLLEMTFDLSKPNKGEKFNMISLRDVINTNQVEKKVTIDLSSQQVSRVLKTHLESKGFRVNRRSWTITRYPDGGQILPNIWPIYN